MKGIEGTCSYLGLELSAQQQELIFQHLLAVLRINEQLNLTAITDIDSALVLHVEDSLLALPEMDASPTGLYGDLGTGGGFPGIPLAVASGREALLVDSSQKKIKALSGIVAELDLNEQVSLSDQRIESLAQDLPESFSVLTARALSSLPVILELASPLLRRGGRFIAFKAVPENEETERAQLVADKVGLALVSSREASLSNGDPRTILTFEKTGEPAVKLPRRVGLAQKRPLA